MHEKAESMANLVMETSPNIVLIVGDDMRILEYSDVGEKYFGKTRSEALKMYLYELIDPANFCLLYTSFMEKKYWMGNVHGFYAKDLQTCEESGELLLIRTSSPPISATSSSWWVERIRIRPSFFSLIYAITLCFRPSSIPVKGSSIIRISDGVSSALRTATRLFLSLIHISCLHPEDSVS